MFSVKSPEPLSFGDKAPRQKKKKMYIYRAEENPDTNDIIIAIMNGFSIENIDPALFSRLITPLYYRQFILSKDNNISALKQVNTAIDYIQKYRNSAEYIFNTSHENITQLIYSDFAINKLINAAMSQQRLPVLPQKLKDIIVQHLEDIGNNASADTIQKRAANAIYLLTKQKKTFKTLNNQNLEHANPKMKPDQEEKISAINRKLEKNLQKLESEKQVELQRLLDGKEIQLQLLKNYEATYKPPQKTTDTQALSEFKEKEHYYLSLRKYKKVDEIREQIKLLISKQENEMKLKWKNEIESQRKAIESTYEEKCVIKTRYYRNRAIKLKREAEEKINDIKKPHVKVRCASVGQLPKLKVNQR